MAAIDKIYIQRENYENVKNYLKSLNDNCFNETGLNISDYINSINDFAENANEVPIANFPYEIEIWLLKNCENNEIINQLYINYGIHNKLRQPIIDIITKNIQSSIDTFNLISEYNNLLNFTESVIDSIEFDDDLEKDMILKEFKKFKRKNYNFYV